MMLIIVNVKRYFVLRVFLIYKVSRCLTKLALILDGNQLC
jgi:hypothetical protein